MSALRRPARRGGLALAAVALGAACCARSPAPALAAASDPMREAPRIARIPRIPDWARRPPAGCAAGLSGPTLHPGDALRRARDAARQALAAQALGVRVVSELRDDGGAPREWTRQETAGRLRRTRAVALEARGNGEDGEGGEVWALACLRGASPPATRAREAGAGGPDWLLAPPAGEPGDPPCELGVAGPTRRPADQVRVALDDGRRALAETLELRVDRTVLDDGRHPARVYADARPGEGARARALRQAAVADTWLDRHASGPLRRPGVLYARVCLTGDARTPASR